MMSAISVYGVLPRVTDAGGTDLRPVWRTF